MYKLIRAFYDYMETVYDEWSDKEKFDAMVEAAGEEAKNHLGYVYGEPVDIPPLGRHVKDEIRGNDKVLQRIADIEAALKAERPCSLCEHSKHAMMDERWKEHCRLCSDDVNNWEFKKEK